MLYLWVSGAGLAGSKWGGFIHSVNLSVIAACALLTEVSQEIKQ